MLDLIYLARVENNANKDTNIYFTLARFWNYNKDSNYEQYRISTELSKYIWLLKEEEIMPRIRWPIVEKVCGKTKIDFCPLCLAENVHSREHFNDNWLSNKRSEFISGCRHQVKLLLKSFNRNSNSRTVKRRAAIVYAAYQTSVNPLMFFDCLCLRTCHHHM